MSKRKTVLWLGVLVAGLPFLGFPAGWKSVVYFISGVLIAVNSYQLSKHKVMRSRRAERKHRENIATPAPEISSTPEEVKASQISDVVPPAEVKKEEINTRPII